MLSLRDNARLEEDASNPDLKGLQCLANRPLSSLDKELKEGLLVYPHSFKESASLSGEEHLFDCYAEGGRALLTTYNLAGFLGLNDSELIIRSRFEPESADGAEYFLHYLLYRTGDMQLLSLSAGTLKERVFDYLCLLFPAFLKSALAQGLFRAYCREEHNDSRPHGPVAIARHLRENLPFKGTLTYTSRSLNYDNPLTELIRHTVEYLNTTAPGRRVLTASSENRQNVQLLIAATPGYRHGQRQEILKRNMRPVTHPYYTAYAPLQKLCLALLSHEKLAYASSKTKAWGLLFDVAFLWEEYLNTLLKPLGFTHPRNREGSGALYLARHMLPTGNYAAFRRYPDFYHAGNSQVIDAKYKYAPDAILDVNQMVTYLYSLRARYGLLVYPSQGSLTESRAQRYELLGLGEEKQSALFFYPFSVPQDASGFETFAQGMRRSEACFKDFVRTLA